MKLLLIALCLGVVAYLGPPEVVPQATHPPHGQAQGWYHNHYIIVEAQ